METGSFTLILVKKVNSLIFPNVKHFLYFIFCLLWSIIKIHQHWEGKGVNSYLVLTRVCAAPSSDEWSPCTAECHPSCTGMTVQNKHTHRYLLYVSSANAGYCSLSTSKASEEWGVKSWLNWKGKLNSNRGAWYRSCVSPWGWQSFLSRYPCSDHRTRWFSLSVPHALPLSNGPWSLRIITDTEVGLVEDPQCPPRLEELKGPVRPSFTANEPFLQTHMAHTGPDSLRHIAHIHQCQWSESLVYLSCKMLSVDV